MMKMRKILLLFIAAMVAVAGNSAEYYGLKVGGVAVTSDNNYNIRGDNITANNPNFDYSVFYLPQDKLLILDNVKIERTGNDNRCIFNDTVSNLTVKFTNFDSYLSSTTCAPLRIDASTTITCDELTAVTIKGRDGDANCIYITNGSKVTFDHATANMNLTGNSNAAIDSESATSESLEFHHSRVSVYSEGGRAIANVNKVKCDYSALLLRTGSSDHYAVSNVTNFIISQPYVNYSVVGYNDNISSITNFTTVGSTTFDASKKTFVDSNGTRLLGKDIIISERVPINSSTFPDEHFRAWIAGQCGSNLETSEIFAFRTINLDLSPNSSLKNVTDWYGLNFLHCLRRLWVVGSKTERLNLSHNHEFYHLKCYNCQMTTEGWEYTVSNLPNSRDERATIEAFNKKDNDQNVIPTPSQVAKAGYGTVWEFLIRANDTQSYVINRNRNYIGIDRLRFPDTKLRSALYAQEYGRDALVYDDELPDVKRVYSYGDGVSDLTGIENFPYLEELVCCKGNLTSVDLSKNPALTVAFLMENKIKSDAWDEMIDKLQVREKPLSISVCYENPSSAEYNDKPTIFQVARANAKNAHFRMTEGAAFHDYVPITNEYFPDDAFRSYLLSQDYGSDSRLYADEALAVTGMNVWGRGIASLFGIKYFPELISLQCYNNSLSTLNLESNRKLSYLDCSNNQIETLNLSKCDSLSYLDCHSNKMEWLSVPQCTKLWYINCNLNRIEYIILPENSAELKYLYCAPNKIKGSRMDNLISRLPSSIVDDGFHVYNPNNSLQQDENIITVDQVQAALARGVTPYWYDGNAWVPYGGYTGYALGDLNHDGQVNVGDVTALYVALLAGGTDPEYDINGDGSVNTGDVSAIYLIILNQ